LTNLAGGKITKHFRNYQIISKEYSKEFSFETNKAPTIGHPERNRGISLDENKETEAADFRFSILIFGEQINDLSP
jgi:preprotein translocase subunit SecB